MNVEKRILIASLLSAFLLAWYSHTIGMRTGNLLPRAPQQTEDISSQHPEDPSAIFKKDKDKQEDAVSIETEQVKIEVGRQSSAIRKVVLKKFSDSSGTAPTLGTEFPVFHLHVGEENRAWRLIEQDATRLTFKSEESTGVIYQLSYTIDAETPKIYVQLSKLGQNLSDHQEKPLFLTSTWHRVDELPSRFNPLEAILWDPGRKGAYKRYISPLKRPIDVPRGTPIVSLTERYFCQSLRVDQGLFDSMRFIQLDPQSLGFYGTSAQWSQTKDVSSQFSATLYFGPRDYFYLKKAGFETAFHIGPLGRIGLIFLVILGWIQSIVRNYGVAVIIFSVLVTCATAPFTLLSFKSMKKMQQLKPSVDKIMARYKENPQKGNQEVFALYKENHVSPLSGCLPMLMQMPIFIAIFQAVPHFIALRGESFLWIKDLSLPDRFFHLSFSLPILGEYLNLLPIVMAAAMFFQTKMSQQQMPSSEANPSSQIMSGPVMPILFCIMFYNIQSALVLYWLTNSLISVAWYRLST